MHGNILFYLKYGTQEEIVITKRLHEVVSNNDFLNNDIYDLENGPEKVENNKEDLQDIKDRFEKYGIKESRTPSSGINSQYIGSQF